MKLASLILVVPFAVTVGCAQPAEEESSAGTEAAMTASGDVSGSWAIDFWTNRASAFTFGWDLESESVGEEAILNHRAHASLKLSSDGRFTMVLDAKRCRYRADWYASGENKCYSAAHEVLDPNADDPRAHTVVEGTFRIERQGFGLLHDLLTLEPDARETGKWFPYAKLTIYKDESGRVDALDPNNYWTHFSRE